MDDLGLLGKGDSRTVEVDVRCPSIRWNGQPPKFINSPVWTPPLKVEWTADVPRRIEWRVKGRPWKTLPETRTLSVATHNNMAVTFEFRAVEEDVFISPETLTVRVAVEFATE